MFSLQFTKDHHALIGPSEHRFFLVGRPWLQPLWTSSTHWCQHLSTVLIGRMVTRISVPVREHISHATSYCHNHCDRRWQWHCTSLYELYKCQVVYWPTTAMSCKVWYSWHSSEWHRQAGHFNKPIFQHKHVQTIRCQLLQFIITRYQDSNIWSI